jgi:hypothetical protein
MDIDKLGMQSILVFFFDPYAIKTKSSFSSSERLLINANLGEADPGGLGANPQRSKDPNHSSPCHWRRSSLGDSH